MNIPPIKVLYVDDELNNLMAFTAAFRRKFDIHTAQSAEEGRRILATNEVHVIISDQRMPGTTGIEFFESIIEQYPHPIRMLITGYSDISAVIGAINSGQVYKYLEKPWDEETFAIYIEKAYEVHQLRSRNRSLLESLKEAHQKLERLARKHLMPELQVI